MTRKPKIKVLQRIAKVLLVSFLLSSIPIAFSIDAYSVRTSSHELHRTVLWQQTLEDGARKLFLLPPSDNISSPLILAYGLRGLYCFDPYNGTLIWHVSPPPSNDSRFHGCTLDDLNNDGFLELVVGFDIVFINDSDSRDIYGLGGFSIYDPYTGTLEKRVYCTNDTDDLTVGNFWFGKGIVYDGAYVKKVILPSLPDKIFYDSYEFLSVFDLRNYSVVYNTSLYNDTDPSTGIIYHPFVHDLNGDGYDEIILSMNNGTIGISSGIVKVINGRDFSILWESYIPVGKSVSESYTVFGAEDCEYFDYNNDNITDVLLTEASTGLALLDGATGEVVWNTFNYGHSDSVIYDIDSDGNLEVLATILEHVAIIDARTGLVKFSKTLNFYFDCSNNSVVDLYSNGTKYIFATSFYGDTVIFSPTFDLIERLANVPIGWVYSYIFYDLNNDGILEFFGCCWTGSNAVFAYVFDVLFCIGEIKL